jgi:hypothetical protein
MGKDYWGDWTVDRQCGPNPPDLDGFKHNQQPMLHRAVKKCSMITTKLRLSMIVTPFPVFKEHWDPNAVITMADDQGGTLDVKLLELLCITRTRYKNKVRRALKMEYGGSAKSLEKGC